MEENERLASLNRNKVAVAKWRRKQKLMAQLNTMTIAPLMAWMESRDRKQGDEVDVTATIVQTPERFFYRLVSIGNRESLVDELKARKFPGIVHMLPVRFKLVCTEVEG